MVSKGRCFIVHDANTTYPESAMVNEMGRRAEGEDVSYSECILMVVMIAVGGGLNKRDEKERQSICTASCPSILFPYLVLVRPRQQYSFLSCVQKMDEISGPFSNDVKRHNLCHNPKKMQIIMQIYVIYWLTSRHLSVSHLTCA